MSTVALVSLGRGQAMGEVRRVSSWNQLFTAVGAETIEVGVAPDRRLHLDGVVAVVRADATPERLAWSGARVRDTLRRINPQVVVVISTRAFDARVLEGGPAIVLDQVDSLARSYQDRAALIDGVSRRLAYRTLARLHARTEHRLRGAGVRRVAAGWSDALTLGAEWVPNLVDPALAPIHDTKPDIDVLFVGTLRYPPNIEALERMARFWPLLQSRRPGTTALIAGSAPTPRIVELCERHGWELAADFTSLPAIATRARVAVAPLSHVAGIQNKVLDAASVGLAQVVSPQALEGFEPGFPLDGHPDDASFVEEIVRLLRDEHAREKQVSTLSAHLRQRYTPAAWESWTRGLLRP